MADNCGQASRIGAGRENYASFGIYGRATLAFTRVAFSLTPLIHWRGVVGSPVNETVFATGARQTVPCTHAYGQLFMRFGLEGAEAVHVGSVGEENRSLLMVLFNGRVSVYDSGG